MPDISPLPKLQSHSVFHTFCKYPQVAFESQHEHEIVILTLRAHPFTQTNWIIISIIGFLSPFVLDVFLVGRAQVLVVLFANVFWTLIVLSFAFYNLLRWVFNVGIITNERVLDVDYVFIQKEITEAAIYDITDATARTTGFFPNLFNYGDVFVQTAGTNENIEFLAVPHPNEAVGIINQFAQATHGDN
ncbi:hypothetical protein A2690_04815 [Candidatus Roizmanbacteria bacterium RIFCSPHIGHO2_01_FULL_39_12b]|uniref:DUF304 domain-containing protein n=1 Tax=Candidatus Roizmanbacteria bacterium RIFCSPHIGHO2_01_FULL_39_12b TaxID=1802030 RepID=A0A1F7GDV8_9BACT|nr:MAG: hypothetical protein A2690_04815 [Candidatus Roizmanbacteria bacterium RIFCSPHIGHO2_01_FULL_39_12b]OGK46056.1 MAG: hypothetical protein A3B46_00875 [Candidatus Roizmanbacteria bacterium RIFCSPLOWO2_01_FULL_39_19]